MSSLYPGAPQFHGERGRMTFPGAVRGSGFPSEEFLLEYGL